MFWISARAADLRAPVERGLRAATDAEGVREEVEVVDERLKLAVGFAETLLPLPAYICI